MKKKKAIKNKATKKPAFITDRSGYIPYPPDYIEFDEDKIPAWIFIDEDLAKKDFGAWAALNARENQFRDTKNPVYAIEAFMLAHELRVYPPLWVIDFLNNVFKHHHSTFGERSLDEIMGFKKGYRGGHGDAYRKIMSEDVRDGIIMFDVFRLTLCSYKLSQDEAYHAVAARLANTKNWDKTGLNLTCSAASSIGKTYEKKYSKIFKKNDLTEKLTLQWLNKNETAFLKSFPIESLPIRVQTELK